MRQTTIMAKMTKFAVKIDGTSVNVPCADLSEAITTFRVMIDDYPAAYADGRIMIVKCVI